MHRTIKFLILDSKEERISKFSSYISELYPENKIIYSEDGFEGWNLIEQNQPSVIICEENLPKRDAQDILTALQRRNLDLFYFIVVTESNSFEHIKDLVDIGFDDYLTDNSNIGVVRNRFRISIRNLLLKNKILEENWLLQKMAKDLEEESNHLIEISARFLQSRMPASYEMLKRIATISKWISEQFKEFDKVALRNIEIAAYFCQAGRIFLPDNLLKLPVMSNGQPRHELMYQVPVAARDIVSSIEKFEPVGEILYHIYENMDGSGIPDHLQSWKIPLASRIIRVVLDYEENIFLNHISSDEALEKIRSRTGRLYDPRIIQLLEQYVRESDSTRVEKEMGIVLGELRPGMVLTRDLISSSGLKLLGSGATIDDKKLKTIVSHSTTDPIYGYIYVESNFYKS